MMPVDSLKPSMILSPTIHSVYYSALPFAPKHSTLYRIFHDRNAFPDVVAGFEKSWRPSFLHIISVDGLKDAVAFSPDGKRVAVAWASYIRVLDLTSGSDAYLHCETGALSHSLLSLTMAVALCLVIAQAPLKLGMPFLAGQSLHA